MHTNAGVESKKDKPLHKNPERTLKNRKHSMKTILQRIKERYISQDRLLRIKDTRLYETYLRVSFPEAFQRMKRQETFIKKIVGKDQQLVFDVGANVGTKARIFSKIFNRVLCLEPDPKCAELLRRRFQRKPKIQVVEKGVGAREGMMEFHRITEGNPRNSFSARWIQSQNLEVTGSRQVTVTTVERLIREHGIPNYLKVDVEGFELEVFSGLQTSIPIISFECNLPEFRKESQACVERLYQISSKYVFNYTDDDATRFFLATWEGCESFVGRLKRFEGPYMEIYARQRPGEPSGS